MLIRIAFFIGFSVFVSESSFANNYLYGARGAGMSNATVMLPGLWSLSHNQAGLGGVENLSVGIFHENRFLINEMALHSMAVAIPTSGGTLAATVSSFGYSKFHDNKFGLAFGRAFTESFMAGVQLNYLKRFIAEGYGKASAVTFEGGIIIKPLEGLFVGAHVFNPVQSRFYDISEEKIPVVYRIGAAYEFYNKLIISVENEKEIDFTSIVKAGLEFPIIENIFLRTGIATKPSRSSFGVGFNLKRIKADIAFTHQPIGVTPHFSIQYSFN